MTGPGRAAASASTSPTSSATSWSARRVPADPTRSAPRCCLVRAGRLCCGLILALALVVILEAIHPQVGPAVGRGRARRTPARAPAHHGSRRSEGARSLRDFGTREGGDSRSPIAAVGREEVDQGRRASAWSWRRSRACVSSTRRTRLSRCRAPPGSANRVIALGPSVGPKLGHGPQRTRDGLAGRGVAHLPVAAPRDGARRGGPSLTTSRRSHRRLQRSTDLLDRIQGALSAVDRRDLRDRAEPSPVA